MKNVFKNFIIACSFFISSFTGLNAHSIKTIVFDCGGVVAQAKEEVIVTFLSNEFQISLKEAEKVLSAAQEEYRNGGNLPNFWTSQASEKSILLPENWNQKLEQSWIEALEFIPGVIELVQLLQSKGFQTAMLSNVKSDAVFLIKHKGMYNFFDPVLLSCEIGVRKPELKAYEIMLQTLKIGPESCIFIDDAIVNVEAARSIGIDSIQFQDSSQLKEELQKRGILLE